MNKKEYEKPAMWVVKIQQQAHLLTGSEVKRVSGGDTGLEFGGGGDGTSSGGGSARSRSFGGFDDWDE